jgi:hypothetical protein
LRPTNAPTIFAMRAIDVDLHQVESALTPIRSGCPIISPSPSARPL